MAVNYLAWNEAIAERLQPIRDELTDIPVMALPDKAGEYGEPNFEVIDWLFPKFRTIESNQDGSKDLEYTLIIRLYFKQLSSLNPEYRRTLDWAEGQILHRITNFKLPGALTSITDPQGQLYAPKRAAIWYKEIETTFRTVMIPTDKIETPPTPPVLTIGADDQSGLISKVEQ